MKKVPCFINATLRYVRTRQIWKTLLFESKDTCIRNKIADVATLLRLTAKLVGSYGSAVCSSDPLPFGFHIPLAARIAWLLKNVLAMMKVIQVIDSSYQVLYLVYLTLVHVAILLPSCYSVKWWNRIKCDSIILNSALTVKLYFSGQVQFLIEIKFIILIKF